MLPFVFLNVIVWAVVVLSILFWWDNRGGEGLVGDATTTAALPEGVLATPNIAAPPSGTTPPEATTATADEPVLHTVQAGETLNIISQQYDVSIDDIMAVNGMDNPNFIAVGQQLTIPIGGIPEPTAAPTEAVVVVALPSPIPTEPAAAGGGVIGVTGIIDPGILETEAVQLVNSGAQQQSIQGWKVRDEDNNVYTFGDVEHLRRRRGRVAAYAGGGRYLQRPALGAGGAGLAQRRDVDAVGRGRAGRGDICGAVIKVYSDLIGYP